MATSLRSQNDDGQGVWAAGYTASRSLGVVFVALGPEPTPEVWPNGHTSRFAWFTEAGPERGGHLVAAAPQTRVSTSTRIHVATISKDGTASFERRPEAWRISWRRMGC